MFVMSPHTHTTQTHTHKQKPLLGIVPNNNDNTIPHYVCYNQQHTVHIKIFPIHQTIVGMVGWIYWLPKSTNKILYHSLTK